jgi:hypothetical protein
MASDAKFRWFEDMNHDEAIPPAHARIVGYCGIRYAKEDQGFAICVTQQTIAANLHMTRKTVNEAFRSARRRGWLTKVAVHQRGPGHHGADTWRLSRPRDLSNGNDTQEWSNPNDTSYDGEWGNANDTQYPNGVTQTAEWCNPNGANGVTQTAEWCNPVNAFTSENEPPKGTYQGSIEGFSFQGVSARGAARSDEDEDTDEPGLRCDQHGCRLDIDGNCPRCLAVSGPWKRKRDDGGAA